VLDLCCGTGSFGIEALSRGAEHVTFVDIKTDLVKKNSAMLDRGTYKIVKKTAEQFLEQTSEIFDIIFIDPPYGKIEPSDVMQTIRDREILANDGILIYEESVRTPFAAPENTFEIYNEKKYGDTKIYYLSVML
jgi:16S rRNA (guanine(966)-N(2))-methyltransferase RsmD